MVFAALTGPKNTGGNGGKAVDGRIERGRQLREGRRQQVLAAARRLFGEKGYHAASVSDVIEAAGIARGTFYLYFESKRAIFDEILDALFVDLKGCMKRIETGPGAPPFMEQLNENLENVFSVLLGDPHTSQILTRTGMGIDADFDRKLMEFYGAVSGLIVRALGSGMSLGVLRKHDPEITAQFIMGGVRQVVFQVGIQPPGKRPSVPALVSELLRFSLEGLLVR